MTCGDLFLALIAVLFPPIAVWVKSGICTADSLINIALCALGYVPGLIHAWYIIAKYPEYDYDGYEPIRGDTERGDRVTYYYVTHAQGTQGGPQPPQGGQRQQQQYGTTAAPTGRPQQNGAVQQPGANEAGSSDGQTRPPPTYAEAVRGDNKIQTQD
ncbi:MAG: hypothetical protein Q9160_002316 [Pyrenula sp. 1 TL-2023]